MARSIIVGIMSVLLAGIASAQTYNCPGGGMMGGFYGGYGTGAMILSWIFSLLVIALIVAGIYWLIKSANTEKRRR